MQRRIRRRYASERRFKLLGLSAVLMSAGFLVFLLATMLSNGIGGFSRTEIKLPVDFPSAGLTLDASRLSGPGADLALAGAGIQGATDGAAIAAFGKDGDSLISDGAWLSVRSAVKADPRLLRGRATISVPASDEIDIAAKGEDRPRPRRGWRS